MNKEIIFICGALRSGTSVTHLMLDSHPEISNPGEFDFLIDKITNDGDFPDVGEYCDWLLTNRIFQAKSLEIDNSLDYTKLIDSFISQIQPLKGILTLNIHRGFDRLPHLFPNAKYIHIVRDPRDVARSSIGMGWAGNVFFGVEHWIFSELSWKRLLKKIRPQQYIEIRFEELISSPQTVLQNICNFAQVPYSDKMLSYYENSTYSKPDPSLIRQWEKKLSIKEVQYVEYRVHELMEQLNFEISHYPLVSIGMYEKFWLTVSNKIFKTLFSINKYGILLFLLERFSRHFRLSSLNKRAQIQINKIDKTHLK